jgi:murein DD-endopeptidase MepM/ murein hydrolase activator NlpD
MSWAVRRGFAALAAAIAITAITSPVIIAQTDDAAAQQAAAEIVAARDRANAAADAFLAAESKQALLELDHQRLKQDVAELEIEVAKLQQSVETVAVDRFVGSGVDGIPILTDLREPSAQLQANVFAQVVANTGATTIDDYDQAKEKLDQKRSELNETERALDRSKEQLLQLQTAAEAEVERLRSIESTRLQNEAVAAAVMAQQREKARQLSEVERRMAESARNAAPTLGVQPPAAVTADSSVGVTSGNIGASGGAAGGRTGGGGTGTNPRAAGDGYVDSIICPVVGGSAYGDSWGAPRSGGRRHEGVDMLAPMGTPMVSVVSGYVEQTTNVLGGTVLRLFGDNGNRYYYAHLSAYEGVSGWVPQGQVIGYIGDTGDATGIPHLHFEIHPGGGVAVNPYWSVLAAGC